MDTGKTISRFFLHAVLVKEMGARIAHKVIHMKLPRNVHKDLLYNFRAGAIEISVLHSNGC